MANQFLELKRKLPNVGIGVGLRREIADETFAHHDRIDWLEFIPENYMDTGGMSRELFDEALDRFPLISHGIHLSIGSTDDLNKEYLGSLKRLLDRVNPPWWSDHLCFTKVDDIYMHDLLPLPFTKEAVTHIAERIKRVQDFIARPFLLENISFYMHLPGKEMTEAQFLSEILERADCGILLDVNNVYVNSINHRFDAKEFLNQIPLERAVQVHVAGHKRIKDTIIDTHGETVIQPVYDLLAHVLDRTEIKGVLLERDQNFPDFEEILGEVDIIREIAARTQPELALHRHGESRATGVAGKDRMTKRCERKENINVLSISA